MTIEDVTARIKAITQNLDDDERAHGMEDSLWVEVLEAIALGKCSDPAALAREALKTGELDFARWCA